MTDESTDLNVDPFLERRLTFSPKAQMDTDAAHHPNKLKPIPWPEDCSPTTSTWEDKDGTLPEVDAVIVTWTAAEWEAMCDVLAPLSTEFEYKNNYAAFEPDFTHKSPAAFSKCLARFRIIESTNYRNILLVHSMLHLATDGPNIPLIKLFNQIIDETKCRRIITTGTAGGIGSDKKLGDVIIGDACSFNGKRNLADKPYNHQRFQTTLWVGTWVSDLMSLIEANFDQLKNVNNHYTSFVGDIETTDFFAFDSSTDHFGLQADNPGANAVEMDDAVLGLVIKQRTLAANPLIPLWGAVRNVSDPQADMTKYATFEDAAHDMARIYRRYGYWTTVPSVIESWCMAIT